MTTRLLFLITTTLALAGWQATAQETGSADGAAASQTQTTTAAAAAVAAGHAEPLVPDFLEHLVDTILDIFDIRSSENTITHYVLSALLLVLGLLARRIVTGVFFPVLRKLAARTRTHLDDKLIPNMESPAAAFVMVTAIFAALKVLKLSAETDLFISYGSRVAYSLTIFWGLWRALSALLDHVQDTAKDKNLGIAAFMPWIKKSLLTIFIIFGVLLTIQGLGYDVKALLAGLGIGGLAFALAAQDTLANVFGSVVVAIDQPFKAGETIRIGGNVGMVEDIGLRSTRIRLIDKSLLIVPNKTVAAEAITNLARFTQRRTEQVIGLTYDTTPAQMDEMVAVIREIILREEGVDPKSVMVFFRDFGASSLDIWTVYLSKVPDFQPYMQMRQRINVGIMRAVEERGLSFAFPTQTVHLAGEALERLGPGRSPPGG